MDKLNTVILNGNCILSGDAIELAQGLIRTAMDVLEREYGSTELIDTVLKIVKAEKSKDNGPCGRFENSYTKLMEYEGAENIVLALALIWEEVYRRNSDSDWAVWKKMLDLADALSKKRMALAHADIDGMFHVGDEEDRYVYRRYDKYKNEMDKDYDNEIAFADGDD